MPAKELARTLGLLPQSPIAPEGITVADLVGRGRHPHQGVFSRWSREDDAAVAAALEATQTTELADRAVDELSGGQRQRVWIAMALAQQTDLLLLDEPTTFLDVSHQVEVLDLLTDLNRTRGTTIVMVLHDLNLAARYADHLVALAAGRIHAAGTPADGAHRGLRARGVRPGQPGDRRPDVRAAPLMLPHRPAPRRGAGGPLRLNRPERGLSLPAQPSMTRCGRLSSCRSGRAAGSGWGRCLFFGGRSLAMTTAIHGSTVPRTAKMIISQTIW